MKRRSLALFAVVVVAGALAGTAFAYFTSSGTARGSVTLGSAQSITVQAVASGSPSSTLVPGGTADLIVQLQNPNPSAVTLTAIAQNGSATPVGGSGCTSTNDGVTVQNQTGLNISVAPGTHVVHVTGAAAMAMSSANGCQGASFDIPVTVTIQP
jgi:hypothetical protein